MVTAREQGSLDPTRSALVFPSRSLPCANFKVQIGISRSLCIDYWEVCTLEHADCIQASLTFSFQWAIWGCLRFTHYFCIPLFPVDLKPITHNVTKFESAPSLHSNQPDKASLRSRNLTGTPGKTLQMWFKLHSKFQGISTFRVPLFVSFVNCWSAILMLLTFQRQEPPAEKWTASALLAMKRGTRHQNKVNLTFTVVYY